MMSHCKEFSGVSSPGVNQFQVLRELLENYPSFDCECSSPYSFPFASRIPESSLNNVEELHPSARSPATSVLVYPRRKKLGRAKLLVDAASSSPKLS